MTDHQKDLDGADMADRTAATDLALIRSMMEAGRRRAGIDGTHFVLWGALLMLAFFAQYMSVVGYIPETIIGIWGPVTVIGWGAEFWMAHRERRQGPGRNIALIAYSTSWASVGLGVLIYFVISLAAGTFDGRTTSILASGLIGAAFFVTARVTGVNWLLYVALGWGLLLTYLAHTTVYDAEMLLVMAGASALLILLPGQLMKRLAADEA
ncbi:MAG: hypothetical protein EP335_16000 [Alphaproteobacteria bacterium]|nr:MAG: hypothetical protein EP335_16000 [Alphaproteobacteria bacterium]